MRLQTYIFCFAALLCSLTAPAAAPTQTNYDARQCAGSHIPYPAPEAQPALPDSLTAVFINHMGRHGARFPSSASNTMALKKALMAADSAKTITPAGRQLLTLADYVERRCHNRWGALDSLGMAEQRGIASRMWRAYPKLFNNGNVSAISSYAPRCVASMFEFCHQLDRLNNRVDIITSSGRQNSQLMRPFDLDTEYIDWRNSKAWEEPYRMEYEATAPTAPARKIVGQLYKDSSLDRELSMTLYNFLSCLPAMGMPAEFEKYFTSDELNALWAIDNLRHYLRYSASTLSTLPADMAAPLLVDLISTTDQAVMGQLPQNVMLRFGHAETMMPLLSLMRLRGAYYMTNYFDTVAMHWRDFDIVPMAANLQIILARSTKGNFYVMVLLNERQIPLLPNSDQVIIPWSTAREYLNRCLPMHLQL